MRIVFAIIFLLCAIDAFAQEPTPSKPVKVFKKKPVVVRTRGIISGGSGIVVEKSNDNRTFEPRTLILGRFGIEHGPNELLLEAGLFKQETGASGISVSRQHQQIDLWYHRLLLSGWFKPYVGAGVGAQRDKVTTKFFAQSSEDTGAFELQLGGVGGARFELGDYLTIWLEMRLATSNNYQPRVLPSAVTVFGFRL